MKKILAAVISAVVVCGACFTCYWFFFRTEDAKTIVEKTGKALNEADSYNISIGIEFDAELEEFDGIKQGVADIELDAKYSSRESLLYVSVNKQEFSVNGKSTDETLTSSYVDFKNRYNYFVEDGKWVKEYTGLTGINKDDVDVYKLLHSLLEGNIDGNITEYFKDTHIKKEKYNGVDCIKVETFVDFNFEDLMDVVCEYNADAKKSRDENRKEYDEAIKKAPEFSDVKLVFYVDAKTYRPIYINAEVGEFLEDMMGLFTIGGETSYFDFKKLTLTFTYSDYNSVDVSMPKKVLEARELYDEYDDVFVDEDELFNR